MTILAMVNAEKEGQIESKMLKARQMEEIREARRKEAEARQEQKKSKLVRRPTWHNYICETSLTIPVIIGGDERFSSPETKAQG